MNTKIFQECLLCYDQLQKRLPQLFYLYPVDNAIGFPNTCPLNSNLSSG